MKRALTVILAVLLLSALLASTALADAGLQNFTEKTPYDGRFIDVPQKAWYYGDVAKATSFGLIRGMTENTFVPSGKLTVAECITLAARMHSIYQTGGESFVQDKPWYQVYVDYALQNGILDAARTDYNTPITRALFTILLSNAFPDEALEPINDIPEGSIPDVRAGDACHDAMYQFYRAGILTGYDATGEAKPGQSILRSEASAILIRMADPNARKTVTLSETLTLYHPEEGSREFPAQQLAEIEAKGWYRYPVVRVYNTETNTVIPLANLEQAIQLGWSTEPFTPVPSQFRGSTSTSIPVLSIDAGGHEVLSLENYVNCTVSTYNVPTSQAISNVTGGVRVRGNSASYYGNVSMIRSHQVPYRIKFDSKVNLLGLNDGAKCKSWVLMINNGGTVDSLKNGIALRMGRMIVDRDGYYCSDGQYVNLFLNGKYMGVYLLCEQQQANKNRVNVAEPEDGNTNLRVGYLVEIDNYSEQPCFRMNYEGARVSDIYGTTRTFRGNDYSVKTDTFSQAQVDFIAKYIRGVFRILYQACENGSYLTFDADYNVVPSSFTNAKDCVSAVADVRSMADLYILYELMCDYDCGEGSFYMCVDFSEGSKFPKLTFTAPWDFEWTCSGSSTGSLFACAYRSSSFISQYGDRSNPWFIILYKQSWFREIVKTRWAEIGGPNGIAKCIAEENALIDQFARDMNRKDSYTADAARGNLRWIQNRANWLDTLWRL